MMHTGAIPSGIDLNDYDFHETYGVAGSFVRDYDFRDLHDWRVQGGPSCVAYTQVAQAQSLALVRKKPLPRLSAEYTWNGARRHGQPPIVGQGLLITGSSCRLSYKHTRDSGFKAETAFPDAPENHGRVPPADVWQSPTLARTTGFHRIMGERNPAVLRDGILTAFALFEKGLCSIPSGVMMVGSGYDAVSVDAAWDGTLGASWGYHAQAIGLYRKSDDSVGFLSTWGGERVFWVPIEVLARVGSEFWCIDSLEIPS